MAVRDSQGFSPFSIALLRGHIQVAKSTLEIVEAQYKPPEANTTESFWVDGVTGGLKSEIVDETFTIENIGEAATHVECGVKPLDVLHWECPRAPLCTTSQDEFEAMWKRLEESNGELPPPSSLINFAIWNDDINLLTFLLELGQQIIARHDSADTTSVFKIAAHNMSLAERLGRIRCMEEIIRRTGGNLPIYDLVQSSGVEIHDKPNYYRGLSIHGKKHPEWADTRNEIYRPNSMNSPPLLTSAMAGNLESTEWFLGTAPGRCYKEFARVHKNDKELKILEKSKLGLEGTIMNWLGSRNHLVLHCALLAEPTVESDRLVQYLVDEYPTCLETKSVEGYTPLQLAFSAHRANAARMLINAGSNQALRDREGRNIVHLFLHSLHKSSLDSDEIRDFLELVDPSLVSSMLTERCSEEPGSLTPIAYWMHSARHGRYGLDSDKGVIIIEILLDLADSINQKPLEMLNGAGNTPLHDAIKFQVPRIFKLIVDRRPNLLHREDATGCTPFELAVNLWTNKVTSEPPEIPAAKGAYRDWGSNRQNILGRSPESFVEGDDSHMSELQIICNICRERGNNGAKRKLVTLYEANEVAKRLASQPRGRSGSCVMGRDEVKRWYRSSYWSTYPIHGW
ncbi:ankyrin repeat protein [Aspergillus sclerotialis]|uniref:Ankyrin repeat protein n=1 Tax=Aspergillus sclerotialis TaxID=2070753 RepID=A0A3A2ZQA7_9EURO|nr:ankyrin repeat protein [Aspergillus sclerotialis]